MNKDELFLKKLEEKLATASLFDDEIFRLVCEDKKAIEEILQVIFNDKSLRVLKVKKQEPIDNALYHSIVFDCLCESGNGEVFDVEVQVDNSDDMQKRVRYHSSIWTVETSPKDKNFKYKNIRNLTLVMICKFDIFKKGKNIYVVDRVIKGDGTVLDNGIKEVYVNLAGKKFESKELEDLAKMFSQQDYYSEKMTSLSKKKKEIIENKVGIGMTRLQREMKDTFFECYGDDIRAEGKAEGVAIGEARGVAIGEVRGKAEGKAEVFTWLLNDGKFTMEEIAERMGMSVGEIKQMFNV